MPQNYINGRTKYKHKALKHRTNNTWKAPSPKVKSQKGIPNIPNDQLQFRILKTKLWSSEMGRESLFHESRGQRIIIKSKSIMKIQGHSSTKVETPILKLTVSDLGYPAEKNII